MRITEVAAAVLERPGEFLLAQRPAGKPYPGYWEFPGGKIEPGEDAHAALVRELREELGIEVLHATPWITRVYAYTHATVRLHFFRVAAWEGEPQPLEEQAIAWQRVGAPDVAPMLPANAPVLAALALPGVMIVSDASTLGAEGWLDRASEAARHERVLFQVREKSMARETLAALVAALVARVLPLGARIVVNSDCASFTHAQGVHLTSAALMQSSTRPDVALVGASCHDAAQLEQAERLALDYAVLGPVGPTRSHPGAATLGWPRFAELARDRSIPVYAIGGLTRRELAQARRHGAHGVALLSAAFR